MVSEKQFKFYQNSRAGRKFKFTKEDYEKYKEYEFKRAKLKDECNNYLKKLEIEFNNNLNKLNSKDKEYTSKRNLLELNFKHDSKSTEIEFGIKINRLKDEYTGQQIFCQLFLEEEVNDLINKIKIKAFCELGCSIIYIVASLGYCVNNNITYTTKTMICIGIICLILGSKNTIQLRKLK